MKTSFNLIELKTCIDTIGKVLKVDELKNYTINEIESNIFHPKQIDELDELQKKIDICRNLINLIRDKLNDIMYEKIRVEDAVKVESNERDGYFLVLTKKELMY